ncbi:MAG: hypothetical protein EAX95_06500 [Candidatus Thorarchaeota archaeon]|nr:hypothetical protein [Candidatus Thorarchaeota archaeon]
MRYGLGILLGALLPGIAFLGGLVIKTAGIGVTDEAVLASLFSTYLLWFFVAIFIGFLPLIAAYAKWRDSLREVLLYEIGGYALFTPIWLFIMTDMSGESFIDLFFTGLENALPAPGEGGALTAINVSPILFVPVTILLLVMGLVILRPSFIRSHTHAEAVSVEPSKPARPAAPKSEDPLAEDLPGVKPPMPTPTTVDELRRMLQEIGASEGAIASILNAGFQTVTDLVSTSSEQLAIAAGLDKATAENIHMLVQKKVWFGGI